MSTRKSKYDVIRGNVFYVDFCGEAQYCALISFFTSKGFIYIPEYSGGIDSKIAFRIPTR